MSDLPPFAQLAVAPDARLDLLGLAMAQEFRPVDAGGAVAMLDALGAELAQSVAGTDGHPEDVASACTQLLGVRYGFRGERGDYDNPDNSMLDLVLARRRGLPILLSVIYIEVARRVGIPVLGVGLPGHFVVGHFESDPPLLLDPFNGGRVLREHFPDEQLQPWRPPEIALRMLNNLVAAYARRGNLTDAIRAARMRLALPAASTLRTALQGELRALQARLN